MGQVQGLFQKSVIPSETTVNDPFGDNIFARLVVENMALESLESATITINGVQDEIEPAERIEYYGDSVRFQVSEAVATADGDLVIRAFT